MNYNKNKLKDSFVYYIGGDNRDAFKIDKNSI